MSLTTRVLPPAEWPRLSGTELEAVWPHLHPNTGTVLVVEDDGQIVGTWALMYVRHAEGCWVSPDHRGKTGVARRLLLGMRELAGDGPLFTAAMSDDVREMLGRLHAQKLPGDHYVLNLGGGS